MGKYYGGYEGDTRSLDYWLICSPCTHRSKSKTLNPKPHTLNLNRVFDIRAWARVQRAGRRQLKVPDVMYTVARQLKILNPKP